MTRALTSNSASPSHRRVFLALVAAWWFLGAPGAQAQPWKLRGIALAPEVEARLHERYPSIDSPEALSRLLRDLALRMPLAEAQGVLEDGLWIIQASSGDRVVDITFDLTTRTHRAALENLSHASLGQVNSPSLRMRVVGATQDYLKHRGYPASRVEIRVEPGREEEVATAHYRVMVDEGEPCLVSGVRAPEEFPRRIIPIIRSGDVCDIDAISKAVEDYAAALVDSGYRQANISHRLDYTSNMRLATVVLQGEIGKVIRFRIEEPGTANIIDDFFKSDELKELDPAIIGPEGMAAELAKNYRARGYDDVRVAGPEVRSDGSDRETHVYTVHRGLMYTVDSFRFEGISRFTQNEILSITGLGGMWRGGAVLNMEEIARGLDALRAEYARVGYWDAQISEPRVSKDSDRGWAQVTVIVKEGMRRQFWKSETEGARAFSKTELRALLPLKREDAFDRSRIFEWEQAVRQLYFEAGYLYADVKTDLSFDDATKDIRVTVLLRVNEGARARIGEISIVGLERTKMGVVQRELKFAQGDWYDSRAIESSRIALQNLGLFRSVQILPADRDAIVARAPVLDMVVDVRESKPGNVSFGPGWTLANGARFDVELSYNNLGGTGRQVYARGGLSEEMGQKAIGNRTLVGRYLSTGYLEPWLLNMPVNGTLSFSHKASANDFWIISNTTESALTHTFNGYLWLPLSTISLFYGQKLNEEIGTTAQEINLITSGNVRIGRAGLRFNVDRRNDLAWPTGGYSLNTEVSAARFFMGGDLRYDQWRATLNTYHRFLWSSVLALQGSMASIDKIDRDSDLKEDILPFSERLWSGGAESVRGYPERGLGPRVAYHPRAKAGEGSVGRIERAVFGGSRSILMKAEARKQIVSETLGLTLFGDLGNTFVSAREEAQIASIYQQDERGAKLEDNVAWEFGDALTDPSLLWKNNYASVGMALAYLTPLGSINLAYGLPWKEPEGVVTHRYHESDYWILTGMFHLNMGATF